MKVEHIKKIEQRKGSASTLEAKEFIPLYAERVHKFLKDKEKSLGDDWVKDTASKLYVLNKNNREEVTNSNTYTGVFIATYCPEISLITGKQLKDLCKDTESKTPLGSVYIDFAIQLNGEPKTNSAQAKALSKDYKTRRINTSEIWVPDFTQLRLKADKDAGLIFVLAEDVKQNNLTLASEYPFNNRIGKNGLFKAILNTGGGWGADDDCLSDSADVGRVVRYDAEGVKIQKFETPKKDLPSQLKRDFLRKFN